jgi:hypothetical protein
MLEKLRLLRGEVLDVPVWLLSLETLVKQGLSTSKLGHINIIITPDLA